MYRDPEKQREAKRRYKRSKKGRASRRRHYERGARHTENEGLPWVPEHEVLIGAPGRPVDRALSEILGRKVQTIQRHRAEIRRSMRHPT